MDRVCSSSVVYRSHDGHTSRGTVAGSVAPGASRSVTRDRSAHRQGAAGLRVALWKVHPGHRVPRGRYGITTVMPGAVPRRRLGQTLRRERCTTSASGLPPAPWTSTTVTSSKRFIRAGKEGSDAVTNRRASAYVPFGHRRALPFRPAGPGVGSDGPLRFRPRGPRPARGFRSGRMSRESSSRGSW